MNHFYITLPCDSFLSFFPDNTVAQYTTKLSENIRLDGDYEVALVDFIYPWSFHNVQHIDKNNRLALNLIETTSAHIKHIFQYVLDEAYHENETDFANSLSQKIDSKLRRLPIMDDTEIDFIFDKTTRKLHMELELNDNVALHMSDSLRSKLGFCKSGPYRKGNYESTDAFDLNAGQRLMYIYSDIAAHVPLGNTKSPLLRICNSKGKYGETIRVTFDRPFYIPVSKREFDTISIDIRDEIGKPAAFHFGKSVVTLHFRRRHSLLTPSS